MGKFEPYSRGELRRGRSSWLLRRNVRVVALVVGIAVMLAFTSAVIVTLLPGAFRWYMLGLIHAG